MSFLTELHTHKRLNYCTNDYNERQNRAVTIYPQTMYRDTFPYDIVNDTPKYIS